MNKKATRHASKKNHLLETVRWLCFATLLLYCVAAFLLAFMLKVTLHWITYFCEYMCNVLGQGCVELQKKLR